MRSLTVAAVVCLSTTFGVRAASGPPVAPAVLISEAAVQTASDRDLLVGTYRLVGSEVKSDDGT